MAESIRPISGKRRKRRRCQVLSDSENDVSDTGISQRLRSRKTRIVETTLDTDKEELIANTGAFSSCVASMASGTEGSTLQESGPDLQQKRRKKLKLLAAEKEHHLLPINYIQ